jgi:hypothetical protein
LGDEVITNAPKADLVAIRRAFSTLVSPGGVVELRVPDAQFGSRRCVVAGYFQDGDALAREAAKYSGIASGVYFTINRVNPALLARLHNRVREGIGKDDATKDMDIDQRQWLPIDIDAERVSGISSSSDEHDAALQLASAVADHLVSQGIPRNALVVNDSGNGAHVLVRIQLPNTPDSATLVKRCLQYLALTFNNAKVHIDLTTYNAARILKIPGTAACKGDNIPERPHRLAKMLVLPETIEVAPTPTVEKLAALMPEETKPEGAPRYDSAVSFDLDKWLGQHPAVEIKATSDAGDFKKYALLCPFNPDHDAILMKFKSGAVAFSCRHNRCQGFKWADFRDKFDPVAARTPINTNIHIYKENVTKPSVALNHHKNVTENVTTPSDQTLRPPQGLAERVEDWVRQSGGGWFDTGDLDRDLGIYDPRAKHNRLMILQRLKEKGIVQQHAAQAKSFRFVNIKLTDLDFKNATRDGRLDLKWPFGIERLVNIFPNNIAVIAGAPDSGKTGFFLEFCRLNLDKEIHYFFSEMEGPEIRERLELYPGMGLSEWTFKAHQRSSKFSDVMVPDAINIIDFLELSTELWTVNIELTDILHKLGTGIALVAIQKKIGTENMLGRGQEFSLEKPKLYLSMDKGQATIVKGKSWANKNLDPVGCKVRFRTENGSPVMIGDWTDRENRPHSMPPIPVGAAVGGADTWTTL